MSSIATVNRSLTASPPSAQSSGEISIAGKLESRLRRGDDAIYRWPHGRGPSPDEVDRMNAEIHNLSDNLATVMPNRPDPVLDRIVAQVYSSFKARDERDSAKTIYAGFLIALPGRSVPAITEAIRRIIRSEAPAKYSRTFVPTAGDLAELTMQIEAEWRLTRDRLRRLLSLGEEKPARPEAVVSPEQSAAARARLSKAVAEAARSRAATAQPRISPAARVAEDLASRRRRDAE